MTAQAKTVDPEEIERFSRIAEEWWDENGKFRPLHRLGPARIGYVRDRAAAHFKRDPMEMRALSGLTLLDVGCGGGLMCEPMTRMGARVTGIDASEKNVAVAKLHAEKMGLEIDYKAMTPEELPKGSAYDIVLALEIVEHVSDVPAFLKACVSLVRPGGLLVMSTLNRTVKSYGLAIIGAEYVLRWLPRGTHQWSKFLKPSELCAGLRHEGMTVHHMTGLIFNPLRNDWRLNERDMDVNYLLSATRPE